MHSICFGQRNEKIENKVHLRPSKVYIRLRILMGSLWEAKAPRFLQMEHLFSGQTVRIRTLISIFAERTCQLVHYTLGWIPVLDLLITHSCLEA